MLVFNWSYLFALATLTTVEVAVTAFLCGLAFGTLATVARLSGKWYLRAIATSYTTVIRGVPDLLVIYLVYFGGSTLLTTAYSGLGGDGFVSVPVFASGALAIGSVAGAFQAEVLRGAFRAISRGELEAARAYGMSRVLTFWRIIVPQIARYALPGMGNVWQLILKSSALVSVIGLVDILRQADIGAGATHKPLMFFTAAAVLFVVISIVSSWVFRRAEVYANRGTKVRTRGI